MAANVKTKVEKNVLTVTVNLKETQGPSKSGKTTIIGTTNGNMPIPGSDATLSMNVWRK